MPLARVTMQRQREAELHRVLREMRTAIDKYKDAVDSGAIASFDVKAGTEGYPPTLETLVEGVTKAGDAIGRQAQVPAANPDRSDDPLDRVGHARLPDKPDSTAWGGSSVYDVYTKATGKALDGTKYRDW